MVDEDVGELEVAMHHMMFFVHVLEPREDLAPVLANRLLRHPLVVRLAEFRDVLLERAARHPLRDDDELLNVGAVKRVNVLDDVGVLQLHQVLHLQLEVLFALLIQETDGNCAPRDIARLLRVVPLEDGLHRAAAELGGETVKALRLVLGPALLRHCFDRCDVTLVAGRQRRGSHARGRRIRSEADGAWRRCDSDSGGGGGARPRLNQRPGITPPLSCTVSRAAASRRRGSLR